MSSEALLWIKVGHIFGFVMWIGTLIGSCHVLKAHAKAGTGAGTMFNDLEKGLKIPMDIGATLTIVCGVLLLVVPAGGMAIFKAGGFFHTKLTLIVVLLAAHIILRRKLRKFPQGELNPPAAWLFPVVNVVALVIIALIVARPF